MSNTNLISIEKIEKAIYVIRGEKVMLDRDLAQLYGVMTGALNQAVRRNRFSALTLRPLRLCGEFNRSPQRRRERRVNAEKRTSVFQKTLCFS